MGEIVRTCLPKLYPNTVVKLPLAKKNKDFCLERYAWREIRAGVGHESCGCFTGFLEVRKCAPELRRES
jgi:hypothetical protein